MAQLKHTVAVGRVRYPAGTTATPELRELIDDSHWDDSEGAAVPAGSGPDAAAYDEQLAQLRELAAAEVEGRDKLIAEQRAALKATEAQVAELRAEVDRLTAEKADGAAPPDPAPEPPVDYMGQTGKQLKDEIDRRNFDREQGDEAYIRVEPPGNKPELAAALQADDARSAAG